MESSLEASQFSTARRSPEVAVKLAGRAMGPRGVSVALADGPRSAPRNARNSTV